MKKLTQSIVYSILFVFIVLPVAPGQAIKVDPALINYKKVNGVGGKLNAVGSDTLNNLMTLWNEEFRKNYPNVSIQVEGKGSATAPPALAEAVAQLGPMSREMKLEEINKIKDKYGFAPTKIAVALDAVAVFVNKNNPLNELSLPEVDAMFSSTYTGGMNNISNWNLVINQPAWNKPISLYGRNSASGTYAFFKESALFKGDYKKTVKERPGSSSVVQSVSEDLGGIGYSGIGYLTTNVKALALSSKKGQAASKPEYKTVLDGSYPLSRYLYIYVLKAPDKALDINVSEFLKFVLSKEGQEITVRDGYLPLPAKTAEAQIKLFN